MFFSPTTARSPKIRLLYAGIYTALILGAVTMIAPFLIMLSGSLEPRSQVGDTMFFPIYLVDDGAMWERYLETKYHGVSDLIRMSWDDPNIAFRNTAGTLAGSGDPDRVALWERFLRENPLPEKLFTMGFMRPNIRMPSFIDIAFRNWLTAKYGSLEGINTALDTTFRRLTLITSPAIRIDTPPIPSTPFTDAFFEFCVTQPQSRKLPWNVGGFYRAIVLPKMIGDDIAIYNERFGTAYKSLSEVPFPPTVPQLGAEPWMFFVSRLLRPDFVELTAEGLQRMKELNLGKVEFIRTRAQPSELIVVSADILFVEWAAAQGVENARIPQADIDREAFARGKGFWKWQFVTLNYQYVLAEISGHGGAIRNTVILVVLSVAGSLLVNPLAAYALSRYKLRSSYAILLFCLATIAFPAEVTMIPTFLQLKELHLLNTFGALVIPGLANGFSIFLLKGFFDSLPRELYEAAELDGASEWVTFWNITMTLSKPILAVIALETFVSAYGTFFYAIILAPDPKMWTIMVYIYQLRQSVSPPVIYASLIVTAIPTLIIFITCQRIILRGIVVPSEK